MKGLVKVVRQPSPLSKGRATPVTAEKKPGTKSVQILKAARGKELAKKPLVEPNRTVRAKKLESGKAHLVKSRTGKTPTPPARLKRGRGMPGLVKTQARQSLAKPPANYLAREKEAARAQSLTAVNRSLDLLEALSRFGPAPLTVLAESAALGKTPALEMLTVLAARNFVFQDEAHGLWRLGARWTVLGRAASEQGALAAAAMPHLAALGNATGENVYLRVRDGMQCETVAIYQTDPGLRVYTEVGAKMPLHAGSGRVLLAYAPESVQTQVLTQRLQRYTPSTRIDPNWIAADLQRIRQRGFIITDSEVMAGTVSICAPVRDASGQVIAALLIGAPSLRLRPPRPRALMPAVVETARKLSLALGAATGQPAGADAPARPNPSAEIPAPNWPATTMGIAIARPHSIFR